MNYKNLVGERISYDYISHSGSVRQHARVLEVLTEVPDMDAVLYNVKDNENNPVLLSTIIGTLPVNEASPLLILVLNKEPGPLTEISYSVSDVISTNYPSELSRMTVLS